MCVLSDDILTLGTEVVENRQRDLHIQQVQQTYRQVIRQLVWIASACEYLQTDVHRWSPSTILHWGGWLSLGFERGTPDSNQVKFDRNNMESLQSNNTSSHHVCEVYLETKTRETTHPDLCRTPRSDVHHWWSDWMPWMPPTLPLDLWERNTGDTDPLRGMR